MRSRRTGSGNWLPYYEAVFGRVPNGMSPRWLCGNGRRGCINPWCIEVVPHGSRVARIPDPALEPTGLTFARMLRDEREARGMTRQAFAREIRVSKGTLKAYEEGARQPPQDLLIWIAKQLGWDGHQRDYMVTFVSQRRVTATSAGAAMRACWQDIERITASPRKAAVVSVKPLAPKR